MEIYELKDKQKKFYENLIEKVIQENREKFIDAIVDFIKFQHKETKRPVAIIGISGGVDSSLTATLCALALEEDKVFAVKIPYIGISSQKSIGYANKLANFLELPSSNIFEIPINRAVDASIQSLEEKGLALNPTDKGNIMARERMKILYTIARIKNGLVVDTCNLTEVMLGYFTRYGDGASDYNPVGNLYKAWVLELSNYLGVPQEIINRTPTAELETEQSDEEDLGISYPAADLMLCLLKNGISATDLIEQYYFLKEIVEQVIKMIQDNKFKNELPPVCKIDF